MPSSHAIADESQKSDETQPLWRQLVSCFLFPLQAQPLMYAAGLALCSLLAFIPLFLLLAPLLILWATCRYAFQIAALASIGITRCEDYPHNLHQDEWAGLPWRLFVVVLVHFLVLLKLVGSGPVALIMGTLFSAFLLPATLMVLITHQRLLAALNPLHLWFTISRVGGSYFLLCFFLFIMLETRPWLAKMLSLFAPEALVVPVVLFTFIYGIWVTAAMIGHVIYRNRQNLDLVPLDKMEDHNAATPEDPDVVEARWRDAQVEQWLQANNLPKALTAAREWVGKSTDLQATLADHRRYHRVLKLAGQPQALTQHAQDFMALLLSTPDHKDEALAVWKSCRKRNKDFQPTAADVTLTLAEHAWNQRQSAPATLALLNGFEKRFPGNASTPQALELIVHALHQGLGDTPRAQRVYAHMKTHWPGHPCTHRANHIFSTPHVPHKNPL